MSIRALAMSPKKWEPVFGSNDLAIKKAQVAQLVEHATENRSVGGSIPPLGTISFPFVGDFRSGTPELLSLMIPERCGSKLNESSQQLNPSTIQLLSAVYSIQI